MLRTSLVLLAFASFAGAEDRYERLVQEALRLRLERRPGDAADAPIRRAYEKLAEAVAVGPDRHEAYELRAVNRIEHARVFSRLLAGHLRDARIRGAPPERIVEMRRRGEAEVRGLVASARDEFLRSQERYYAATGRVDPQLQAFMVAALKHAEGHHLRAPDGRTGAIDDWKSLVQARFQPERCSEFIAWSYNEVARAALTDGEHDRAQEYWDRALRWAQSPFTREMVFTNKAGAYEQDNQFGRAEEILERQIERQPHRADHWKNLGLVLGYQNELRRALHTYGRARDLCRRTQAPFFFGLLHGNAWLKAAMIHGKLLEADGDLRLAWRLFMEYRAMLGDDYNFSVAFGDFCFHVGQYDLAWTYLHHARNLQPVCPGTYQLLLQVAPRTAGTRDEVAARTQRAKADWKAAQDRFSTPTEDPAVARACGGHHDLEVADAETRPRRLDPDPLAGFDVETAPAWIEAAAARRRPFVAWTPTDDESSAEPAARAAGRSVPVWALAASGLALLLGVLFLFRRRRASAPGSAP